MGTDGPQFFEEVKPRSEENAAVTKPALDTVVIEEFKQDVDRYGYDLKLIHILTYDTLKFLFTLVLSIALRFRCNNSIILYCKKYSAA